MQKTLSKIKDSLFPAVCAGCGQAQAVLCEPCLASFVRVATVSCPFCRGITGRGETCGRCRRKFTLSGAFVGARINSRLKSSVHTLKYRHGAEIAPMLTKLTISQIELHGGSLGEVVLVPVPADPKRGKERLYNPPSLIASEISRRLGYPVTHMLSKKRTTPQQAGLNRGERLGNLLGAFEIKGRHNLSGKTVILVDDVATTFSTLEAAARTIKPLRPRRIWSAVIGHGRAN